jgi:ElaB/YqjD/DUF883 family membrane-anchored ribosome-binding protein
LCFAAFHSATRKSDSTSFILREGKKMIDENQRSDNRAESTSSFAGAAKKADEALRETAQEYIDRTSVKLDLKQLEEAIRQNPMPAAGLAAAAGFVVGGGLTTSLGLGLLGLFGREAVRQTARNFMSGMTRPRNGH